MYGYGPRSKNLGHIFHREVAIIMPAPENIIFHCSASKFGDAALIRKWHLARGWRDIGYHFVALNGCRKSGNYRDQDDGLIEVGRPLNESGILEPWEFGAHALGYNARSIGVCFVGNRFFTSRQLLLGIPFLAVLAEYWDIPTENILGHRETGANKECPTMDEHLVRGSVRQVRPILSPEVRVGKLTPWTAIELIQDYVA